MFGYKYINITMPYSTFYACNAYINYFEFLVSKKQKIEVHYELAMNHVKDSVQFPISINLIKYPITYAGVYSVRC